MADAATALVSVRGEARVLVAPDSAGLNAQLRTTQDTKVDALRAVANSLDRLTSDLTALGGIASTAQEHRQPLTWSAYSATTETEYEHDSVKGQPRPTGRVAAIVALSITVRAFELLDRLGGVLATHDDLNVHHVGWSVDAANPAWPQVRAAAIKAAITKGHDYASALGGSLVRIEHVADVGLLGSEPVTARAMRASFVGAGPGGRPDTPSLDPVPQELVAAIDARFIATVAAL